MKKTKILKDFQLKIFILQDQMQEYLIDLIFLIMKFFIILLKVEVEKNYLN